MLLVPDADDLGLAVLTNASAIVAAGHEGQYDIGLGLARILIGEDPQPRGRSTLLTFVVPAIAWGAVVLLIITIVGQSAAMLRARRLMPGRRRNEGIARLLLPGGTFVAVGAGLLTAPLGPARHFYPDTGCALTPVAYLAVAWGTVRLALGVTVMSAGAIQRRANADDSKNHYAHRPTTKPTTV